MSDVTTTLSILLSVTKGALLTAALIVLIRLIFRRVLTAKAKYYLWLLLALRLMLPVVPGSPVSLLNFLPEPGIPVSTRSPEAPTAPDPVLWEHDPEAALEEPEVPNSLVAADLTGTPGMVEEVPAAPEAPDAPVSPTALGIPRTAVLFWTWLAGAGLLFLFYCTLYTVTAIRLKRLPVCTDSDTLRVFLNLKRVLGVNGKVRLVSGGAGMLGGVFHSAIVLPVEQHGEEVSPIIVHELLHYKYRDLRIFVLFRLLASIYWFNPVVWVLLHVAKLDCEAACDQRVLETNLVSPGRYARALYEEGSLHMKKGVLLHTTFGGSRHSLKHRIRLIAAFQRPTVWVTALTVVLAVIVTACTMTGASPKAEIRAAIVGAEESERLLHTSRTRSGDPTSEHLTEDEITAQVDAMDKLLRQYYTADSLVLAGVSGEEGAASRISDYANNLRTTWADPGNLHYLVDGSILSCKLSRLQVHGDTATVKAELVTYSNTVETDEAGKFVIRCGGSLYEDLTYHLVKEDNVWKVQKQDVPGGDAWMHPWSADIGEDTFDTFEEALAAAKTIDGQSQCPYKNLDTDISHISPFFDSTEATNLADFEAYMESRQPPNGAFGLTFDEHVDRGLLNPEDGTVEHYTRDDCDLSYSLFRTTTELGGQTVPIDYNFSQTVLSEEEILTQVFVTPPEDVPLGTWLSSISDPWLSGLTQNTDLNGWEWNTDEYVADFLKEEQLQTVIDAQLAMGETSTSSEFPKTAESAEHILRTSWRVVKAFSSGPEDENSELIWQFNGTGAALITAAQKGGADTTDSSILEDTASPSAAAVTPPSYGRSDPNGITYESTAWGMTPEEVLTAEGLQAEDFPLQNRGQNYSMEGPIPNHPEVESVEFEFHFTDLDLSLGLDFVQVQYDTEAVGFEELLALRTSQLGPPTSTRENAAHWDGTVGLTLALGKNGFLREMCNARGQTSATAADTLSSLDIEDYLSSVEPPNGHYGWTYEEHVAAGLLDPEQGSLTLAQDTEAGRVHTFTTSMELGDKTVDAVYVFSTTMATIDGSGKQVLTQVMVTPPEGIAISKWVSNFSDSFTDKLFESQNLIYKSPLTVGGLLPESQQAEIMDAIRAHNDGTAVTLGGWPLVQNWYQQNARIWHFNGTGAALYLTAQSAE